MVAYFSGHSKIDVGNVSGRLNEFNVANRIIGSIGNCEFSDYDTSQNELLYRQLSFLKSKENLSCGVVLHFPYSQNEGISISTITYLKDDVDSFFLSERLADIFFNYGIDVQILDHKESEFKGAFLMKKSDAPILLLEPFYLSRKKNMEKLIYKTIQSLKQFMIEN